MTERPCPPDPEVAPFGICEIALVAELHAESFPREAWSTASLARILALPGSFGLLARVGGQPLGFVLARVAADECEILTLAVRPGWRRRGVAGGLLVAALAHESMAATFPILNRKREPRSIKVCHARLMRQSCFLKRRRIFRFD